MLTLISMCIVSLSACSAAAASSTLPASPGAVTLTVTASEFRYDPPVLKVRSGQQVTLIFKNNGTLVHEFRMVDGDFRVETKAGPGGSDTLTFTAPQPGTYKYICNIPGHAEAGMFGELVVQ